MKKFKLFTETLKNLETSIELHLIKFRIKKISFINSRYVNAQKVDIKIQPEKLKYQENMNKEFPLYHSVNQNETKRLKENFDQEYSKLFNEALFEIEKRNNEIINLKEKISHQCTSKENPIKCKYCLKECKNWHGFTIHCGHMHRNSCCGKSILNLQKSEIEMFFIKLINISKLNFNLLFHFLLLILRDLESCSVNLKKLIQKFHT
ncbi:hypothetical protein BpHYR1_031737 [Brachionus plicatilis]|uniref:ETS domain-containing protein n=1 Tax=Brachionus plicatilis TaxID=10195 RepID=A0A3M7SFW7_BRAPC|nr:hypothetical protein BpHYR1_031737 [Brachionus plicatilis]